MKLSELAKVLPYFELENGSYHIKDGFICVFGGFSEDLISMIHQRDEDKDEWRLYSMISDSQYVESNLIDNLNIYKTTKVV